MQLSKERMFSLTFVFLGILLAVLGIFIPLKYILVLLVAASFGVFSFFRIDISFGLFFVFMSIVPHQYWNNMIIFLASVFYFSIFILKVLIGKSKGFNFKDINIFLVFFVFFSVYSVFMSTFFSDSLRMFIILASGILFSITLMGIVQDKKSLDIIISFICVGIVLTAIYGLYQKMVGVEVRTEFIDVTSNSGTKARIFSTMDNPNNYAEYLILFLPLCFSYFLNTKNELKKLLLVIISLIGMGALVLTLSRGAYVAFAVGMVVYILLVNKKLMPFCIILGFAAIPFVPNFIIERLLTIGKDSSSSYRLLIWQNVYEILKDYWYKGIGMGPEAFINKYAIYYTNSAYKAMHSHNLMLNVLVEMGIGGFITFIMLLFTTTKSNLVAYLNSKDPYIKNILAALIYAIISISIYSMAEYVWYYPRIMLSFWIILGLSYATLRLPKGENL